MRAEQLRQIPSVSEIAKIVLRRDLVATEDRAVPLARMVQDSVRSHMLDHPQARLWTVLDEQLDALAASITGMRYRPVLNATGILVHTNLGRSSVSKEAAAAMQQAAMSTVALEVDPETGRRGGRMAEIASLLRMLTGVEAALVVNNNAAAILLVLSALCSGGKVAVSRAEAVEIGGSFRIPDVLAQSGATLLEVGTTNRTYASDYATSGIGEGDAMLKVHSSNFSIVGFTATPTIEALRSVATRSGALLLEDLGSGTFLDTAQFGIEHEPTVQESIGAGVDVVTFSGDKLLGGPQAGIIVGRRALIERISAHPLARAVRADKSALAGMAATLRHYVRGDALETIPLYRMLRASSDDLRRRAESIAGRLDAGCGVVDTVNHVGGGALPGQQLPGVAIRLEPGSSSADQVAQRLRNVDVTSVYGRIEDGGVLIELRSVLPEDDDRLFTSLQQVAIQGG